MSIKIRDDREVNDAGEYSYFVNYIISDLNGSYEHHSVIKMSHKIRNANDLKTLVQVLSKARDAELSDVPKISGSHSRHIVVRNFFQMEALND